MVEFFRLDSLHQAEEQLAELRRRVSAAAASMRHAEVLMRRLRDDAAWHGTAGEAFRERLHELSRAGESLENATTTLTRWGAALAGFRESATTLESEAAWAQRELEMARPLGSAAVAAAEEALEIIRRRAHDLHAEWHDLIRVGGAVFTMMPLPSRPRRPRSPSTRPPTARR